MAHSAENRHAVTNRLAAAVTEGTQHTAKGVSTMQGKDYSPKAYIMTDRAYDALQEVYCVFKAMTSIIGCEETDFTDMPMYLRIGIYYALSKFLSMMDNEVILTLRGICHAEEDGAPVLSA